MLSHIKFPSVRKSIKRFHSDERGMQSIETVVILAIAAVVVVGIFWLWDQADVGGNTGIKGAVANLVGEVFDKALSSIGGIF